MRIDVHEVHGGVLPSVHGSHGWGGIRYGHGVSVRRKGPASHRVCIAIRERKRAVVKTWFNAALQVGAKFRDLAYVASMVEFETTRYSNNRFHETFGDWI